MNHKKTLIIMLSNPISKRDEQRFGLGHLAQVFDLKVWNCSEVYLEGRLKNIPEEELSGRPEIVNFYEEDILLQEVRNLDENCLVLLWVDLIWEIRRLFDLLSKSSVSLVFGNLGLIPFPIKSRQYQINSLLKNFYRPNWIKDQISNRFFKKNYLPCTIDYLWVAGKNSLFTQMGQSPDRQIIYAHLFDYDIYLDFKNLPSEENHLVFLDEYQPYHPDYFKRSQSPLNPERYFEALNHCFDRLENICGLPVVIAAHPRSQYEKHGDVFKGRKMIKGDTVNLVRTSKLVLTHGSTANSFSALFSKPVLGLTSDEMEQSFLAGYLEGCVQALHTSKINIDQFDLGQFEIPQISNNHYRNYIETYLKCDPEEHSKKSYEILSDYLIHH